MSTTFAAQLFDFATATNRALAKAIDAERTPRTCGRPHFGLECEWCHECEQPADDCRCRQQVLTAVERGLLRAFLHEWEIPLTDALGLQGRWPAVRTLLARLAGVARPPEDRS